MDHLAVSYCLCQRGPFGACPNAAYARYESAAAVQAGLLSALLPLWTAALTNHRVQFACLERDDELDCKHTDVAQSPVGDRFVAAGVDGTVLGQCHATAPGVVPALPQPPRAPSPLHISGPVGRRNVRGELKAARRALITTDSDVLAKRHKTRLCR